MAKDDDPLLEDYLSMDQALSQIEEIAHEEAPQQTQAQEISEWYQKTPDAVYDRGGIQEQEITQQPEQQNYQPEEIQQFGEWKEKKDDFEPYEE